MSDAASPTDPQKSRRRALLISGTVLWLLVGLSLIALWQTRPASDAAAQTESADEPPQKSLRIRTGTDGKLTIEEQPAGDKEKNTPLWDPNGIEDFSFTNCDGRTITKQDLLGKPWAACFVFTHCVYTCPAITKSMRELQDRLKDQDVRFVSFSVDPDRDTPEVLQDYAEANGADLSRWYFLWGKPNAMYGLIHRSFQMPVQMPDSVTENYQVIHSNYVMLVDDRGVVQGKYNGLNTGEMAKLTRAIRKMLHPQEAEPADALEVSDDIASEDAETEPKLTSTDAPHPPPTVSAPAHQEIPADAWYVKLPAVNAGLNGLATVLLSAGFLLIKQKRVTAHRNVMLTAFVVSIVFLACYLVYHDALYRHTGSHGREFSGTGASLIVYRTILVTHVLLAMAVPVLALITIYRAWKADWARHRKIARITFPIWMYVSVTGVIIYLMLYHWPVAA